MSMEINLTLEDVLLPQREGYRKLVARTLHSLSSRRRIRPIICKTWETQAPWHRHGRCLMGHEFPVIVKPVEISLIHVRQLFPVLRLPRREGVNTFQYKCLDNKGCK